jgi:outer membrane protein TolC
MRLNYVVRLLFICLLAAQTAATQEVGPELTIGKLVERVLSHNSDISISKDNLRIADLDYRETLADYAPALALDETGYTVTKSSNALSNKIEFGLVYSQELPTSGSLELELENDFTLRSAKDEDLSYRQSPSISLGWNQPVFVNGKFIDTEVTAAERQKAKLDREKTQESNDETTNTAIQDALTVFFDVIDKRNDAAYRKARLDWHRRDLMILEKKRELKLITEMEVWEKKLEIGDLEEELYELRLELQESEKDLAHHLGLDDLSELTLNTGIPAIKSPNVSDDLYKKVLEGNPTVAKEQISLKTARLNTIIDDLDFASTLEAELSFTPQYTSSSDIIYTPTFQESFTRFFESEADYSLSLSLLLTVPIIDGGKRALEKEKNRKLERIAYIKLQTQKRLAEKDLEIALQKHANLFEKVNLLRDHVQLNKKQLEIQEKLFELKQITAHDVESVELDLINQQNKLWRAEADLVIATLDLIVITGQDLYQLLKNI